ncbi:MAG TPA: DUF29 domain-containing protein [Bryobacteraceae bacterium]|nr:DUF29 domain-containing protein [Bryobacteraceae bacterium]
MKYETDFHAWTFEQARRLRAGEPVDVENVAEELETLGRSEQEQLTNRLAVLLQHVLKSEFQPEKKTAGWDATIKEQRRRVNRLLEENPSLRRKLPECITRAYQTAVTFASVETGMLEEDFPATCLYTEQLLLSGAK